MKTSAAGPKSWEGLEVAEQFILDCGVTSDLDLVRHDFGKMVRAMRGATTFIQREYPDPHRKFRLREASRCKPSRFAGRFA